MCLGSLKQGSLRSLDITCMQKKQRNNRRHWGKWFVSSPLTHSSVWKMAVLILVKESLSCLIEWRHWLANQWHAVHWRHIFRMTHLTWNPSWAGKKVSGNRSYQLMENGYKWKRAILLLSKNYQSSSKMWNLVSLKECRCVAQSCSGETALFCCEVRLELFGLSYVESKHSSVRSQPLEWEVKWLHKPKPFQTLKHSHDTYVLFEV